MGYKKQEWFELKRNGIMFEMIVRDQDWTKLETKKFKPQDFTKSIRDIKNRYGLTEKEITPNKEFQDEIGWLKKESILK